jgi:hypothetical protein
MPLGIYPIKFNCPKISNWVIPMTLCGVVHGFVVKGGKSPFGSRSRGIVRDLKGGVIWQLSLERSYTVVYIDCWDVFFYFPEQ